MEGQIKEGEIVFNFIFSYKLLSVMEVILKFVKKSESHKKAKYKSELHVFCNSVIQKGNAKKKFKISQ